MGTRIYKLATIGDGFLAVMPYPIIDPARSDPFSEIANRGIRHVVSLLETGEARYLGLEAEAELVGAQAMDFTAFPIPDMGLPRSLSEFTRMTLMIQQQINAGNSTLIHCRGGIGRSGLVAAGVLMQSGQDLEQALEQISARRGETMPETRAQRDWLQTRFLPCLQQQPAAATGVNV